VAAVGHEIGTVATEEERRRGGRARCRWRQRRRGVGRKFGSLTASGGRRHAQDLANFGSALCPEYLYCGLICRGDW
jgi:hypothetical protein